jgi:hypothetical protein
MPTIQWPTGAVLSALLLCGCDTLNSPLPVVPAPDLRIYVTARSEYPSAGDAKIRASNLAGVPVRDVEDLGVGRYRMTLVCPDAATCRSAVQRIADDRFFALGVDAESPQSRQRIPVKPSRESAR